TGAYKELGEKYIKHKVGFFILAPSGVGKTHFIKNQKEQHWIDGDEVWMMAKAHPDGQWWLEDISVIDEIDQRSDVITVEAKKLGFWIMGASNYWLKPDAVVIPDWETHQSFISKRENSTYDGGATSEDLERVKKSRNWMSRWEKEGVTIFKSIENAVNYLVEKNNKL
ncbi:MAG: hypothetical protein HYT20_03255, partial [Candidatus Nealsonbacteria bacterium]|nr:hypothetical protein [Candidatus Nealsonbacteria bacterium]